MDFHWVAGSSISQIIRTSQTTGASLSGLAKSICYGMLVHCIVTLSIKYNGTHLCTLVKTGTMRVNCIDQDLNVVPRPQLDTRLLDSEPGAITIKAGFH